jgi:hypothetical protein
MRTVVLLVDAVGGGCGPLTPLGGHTIYDAGGAHAAGVEGSGVSSAGAVVTWPAGAAAAQPGMVVRAVRPKGVFDDYPAVGLFATLAAVDKGIEIHDPVASSTVVSVGAGQLTLSAPLGTQPGDVLYLGDAFGTPSDGQSALALAGAPGNVFARVMVDQGGARNVLHHRAIDIASDNRIPPGKAAFSNHTFTLPNGCSDATVRVWALYRPLPIAEAALRGWPSQDHLIASAQETVLVP